MNAIFTVVLILSAIVMTFTSPDLVLKSMLDGGQDALTLTLKLVTIYAVWMGLFSLLESTKTDGKFAKLLKPMNKSLFGQLKPAENDYISLNVASNILGISGATTPMGIKAVCELEKRKNTEYQIAMFFVINATSVQIIPSSILALRTSLGATNPSDVILPTIISTLVSTVIGVLLVKIFIKKDV